MTADEKHRFKAMEDQLSEIDQKVDEILSALKGDELGHNDGLISEFKELKSRVRKLEVLKNRVIWTAIGAGIAGGISISKIVELLAK